MADDPTTTGPATINASNIRAALPHVRTIPGANVIEHFGFTLDFKGDLIFTVSNNALTISLEVGPPDAAATALTSPRAPLTSSRPLTT